MLELVVVLDRVGDEQLRQHLRQHRVTNVHAPILRYGTDTAAGRLRVRLQERQRPPVELLDLLVDRRVRRVVEYYDFGISDSGGQRLSEPSRGDHVVLPERDERRRRDGPERGRGIVPEDRT